MKKTNIVAKKKSKAGSKDGTGSKSASRLIDARIKELGDWRGKMLSDEKALKALIRAAVEMNTSSAARRRR